MQRVQIRRRRACCKNELRRREGERMRRSVCVGGKERELSDGVGETLTCHRGGDMDE
jgi:hypothetical protein